jgi:hypothetical protein
MVVHSEFFWSRRSAERVGERLQGKHSFSYTVCYARRADGSHDWLLTVSA